jgi:hypothetical protein
VEGSAVNLEPGGVVEDVCVWGGGHLRMMWAMVARWNRSLYETPFI